MNSLCQMAGCNSARADIELKAQVDGHVLVETADGSASPLISCAQGFHLFRAIENWRVNYWIPREVNRIFARQIRPRGLWQRILDRLEAWLPERTRRKCSRHLCLGFRGQWSVWCVQGQSPTAQAAEAAAIASTKRQDRRLTRQARERLCLVMREMLRQCGCGPSVSNGARCGSGHRHSPTIGRRVAIKTN